MNFETIDIEEKDSFCILKINRPEKLNALNKKTFDELDEAMTMILGNSKIHGLIITGSGEKAFVAGADINELEEANSQDAYDIGIKGQAVFNRLMNSPIPVIAAVNGFALGGGCELAMACHFRYASENAKFGQPEVNLGLIPGYAGTQRLTRLVGKGRALELLMTGDIISADEAFRIGLVNKLFPADRLIEESLSTLQKIASKAPLAIKYCIETVNKGENMSLAEAMNLEASYFALVHSSEDAKEGCSAFINKRKANFQGK